MKPVRKTEVELRVGKLRNGKIVGKDDVIEGTVNCVGELVINWIWKLCNMAFESVDSSVMFSLYEYKGKGERT